MSANRPVWTARCKSGYQFAGRPCNRACSRGQLLCAECATATATALPVAPRFSLSAWLSMQLASYQAAWRRFCVDVRCQRALDAIEDRRHRAMLETRYQRHGI